MPSLADAPLPFPHAALRGSKDSLWQDWQITPDDGVRSDKARKDQALKSFDTGAKPFSQGKKAADLAATEALAQRHSATKNQRPERVAGEVGAARGLGGAGQRARKEESAQPSPAGLR